MSGCVGYSVLVAREVGYGVVVGDRTMSEGQSGARTQAQQNALLEVVRAAWAREPHQRFCQLIVNATRRDDPFYVEDDDLAEALMGLGR